MTESMMFIVSEKKASFWTRITKMSIRTMSRIIFQTVTSVMRNAMAKGS